MVLCAVGPVRSPAGPTLAVGHRRAHGAMHEALNSGWLEPGRLRRVLDGLAVPRLADGRIAPAVDVFNWFCPDAPTSPDRLFCHESTAAGSPRNPTHR